MSSSNHRREALDGIAAIADREWREIIDPLLALGSKLVGKLQDPHDPQARQDIYRLLYSQIANGFMGLVTPDPEYPDFFPAYNRAVTSMGVNPDNVFVLCPLESSGTYRISGHRGTVRIVAFNVGGNELFRSGAGTVGPTLNGYQIDNLHIQPDGSFEVILSQNRPAGYTGDWWKMDAKATHLLVRQVAYDWANEVDARLAIDRIDRPVSKPRPSAEKSAAKLKQIATWAERWSDTSIFLSDQVRSGGNVNKFGYFTHSEQAGIRDDETKGKGSFQRYYEGIFELEPDEAWVIEMNFPFNPKDKGVYWGIQLCDEYYADFMGIIDRQTNFNGLTATLDSDGKFRAVVSAQDPGVPNWLDSGGYRRVIIVNRWLNCEGDPAHKLTRVKFKDIHQHLPTDTPRVTAEARDTALRLRKKLGQMRRNF